MSEASDVTSKNEAQPQSGSGAATIKKNDPPMITSWRDRKPEFPLEYWEERLLGKKLIRPEKPDEEGVRSRFSKTKSVEADSSIRLSNDQVSLLILSIPDRSLAIEDSTGRCMDGITF